MDLPRPPVALHPNSNPCADGAPVGFPPFQYQRDPVMACAGVQEQAVLVDVAFVSTSQDRVDILISIVIDITERHAVTLL